MFGFPRRGRPEVRHDPPTAAASTPGVVPQVTAYEVCAVPHDEWGNYLSFTITVERTHHTGRWAIRHGSRCLSTDGRWDWESIPSERTDGWLATHRFDLDTALKLATEAAPGVVVNGWTVADAIAEAATSRKAP